VKCAVVLTAGALLDLTDIHEFVERQDGLPRADRLLDASHDVLDKLSNFPARGEFPPELRALGIKQFRQVHHKPYRMIYQVGNGTVIVLLVADGRRDMQTLLQRRLLT
jgi:toxin ParE1/3/4